jgi:hypothetical protein
MVVDRHAAKIRRVWKEDDRVGRDFGLAIGEDDEDSARLVVLPCDEIFRAALAMEIPAEDIEAIRDGYISDGTEVVILLGQTPGVHGSLGGFTLGLIDAGSVSL